MASSLRESQAATGEFLFWRPKESDVDSQVLGAKLHERSGALPLYELEDVMVSTSTSVNKGLQWNCPCKFSGARRKVSVKTVEKQNRLGVIRGMKTDKTYSHKNKFVGGSEVRIRRFHEPHVLNVLSEARHGLHKTDAVVKQAMGQDRTKTGDSLVMRAHGRERRANTSTITGPPIGVSTSIEPNLPTADFERINEKLVAPIPSFIS